MSRDTMILGNGKWRRAIAVVLMSALAGLGAASLASTGLAAGGTGPGDALVPTGAKQTIAAGANAWYRFDYGGGKSTVTVAVNTDGVEGLEFLVYTPQAVQAYLAGDRLTEIGQGHPSNGHDLAWEGRFNFSGTFYIILQNRTEVAIDYRLTVTGDAVTTVKNVVPTATPIPNPFATQVPVGSVSGGRILFQETSGGNIDVVNADGSGLQRITTGLDPVWSPDGRQIAFVRQGPEGGLFTANGDGSNEQRVAGPGELRSPTWSPDGGRIAFAIIAKVKSSNPVCFGTRCFQQEDQTIWRIQQVDLADNTVKDILTPAAGGVSPTFNPDGNTIAFVGAAEGLMLTAADNHTNPYIIAGDLNITSPRFSPLQITSPVYSPDGSRIAFMLIQQPAWQIGISNADGSNVSLLTRIDPLDFQHPNNVAPAWSPDGKQVLFLSDRHGKWEFYAVGIDGTNQRQVLKSVTDQVSISYTFGAERVASWTR